MPKKVKKIEDLNDKFFKLILFILHIKKMLILYFVGK